MRRSERWHCRAEVQQGSFSRATSFFEVRDCPSSTHLVVIFVGDLAVLSIDKSPVEHLAIENGPGERGTGESAHINSGSKVAAAALEARRGGWDLREPETESRLALFKSVTKVESLVHVCCLFSSLSLVGYATDESTVQKSRRVI